MEPTQWFIVIGAVLLVGALRYRWLIWKALQLTSGLNAKEAKALGIAHAIYSGVRGRGATLRETRLFAKAIRQMPTEEVDRMIEMGQPWNVNAATAAELVRMMTDHIHRLGGAHFAENGTRSAAKSEAQPAAAQDQQLKKVLVMLDAWFSWPDSIDPDYSQCLRKSRIEENKKAMGYLFGAIDAMLQKVDIDPAEPHTLASVAGWYQRTWRTNEDPMRGVELFTRSMKLQGDEEFDEGAGLGGQDFFDSVARKSDFGSMRLGNMLEVY